MTQVRAWGEDRAKSWESKPTINRIGWSHLGNKSSDEIKITKILTIAEHLELLFYTLALTIFEFNAMEFVEHSHQLRHHVSPCMLRVSV